jgi:hypothetical protein
MAWHGMAWHGMAWHGMAWHVCCRAAVQEPQLIDGSHELCNDCAVCNLKASQLCILAVLLAHASSLPASEVTLSLGDFSQQDDVS